MALRKTGTFHPAEEIAVPTCDICERDIGYEDGSRPRAHLVVTRHPNVGGLNEQAPPILVCSRECLEAYAAKVTGLDRQSGVPKSGGPGGRRKRSGAS